MKKLAKNDEEDIQDKAKAREIIQVVLDYGINQSQIYHMLFLLSTELENINHMKTITKLLKSLTSEDNKQTGLITGELQ
tara:strand:- start:163 stop:399 length:237 start_codon:yes stop_codon:yes gene_type:complete